MDQARADGKTRAERLSDCSLSADGIRYLRRGRSVGWRDGDDLWRTIRIEVGHNEIGDADEFETALPSDLAEVFEKLSFLNPSRFRS